MVGVTESVRLLAFCVTLLAATAPAMAQLPPTIVLEGRAEPEIDARIARILAAGDFQLVTGDTVIAARDTVPVNLLVLGGSVYLEGTVSADLVGVAANLFLRPTAHVRGDVVNAGGGVYRSELATVGGRILDRPTAPYQVAFEPNAIRIIASSEGGTGWTLRGIAGFLPPTYDRVNGLTPYWGATYTQPLRAPYELRVDAMADLPTRRGRPGGELTVTASRGAVWIGGEIGRLIRTNEAWIRDRLTNSFSFLFAGRDYLDYYEADRLALGGGAGWRAASAEVDVALRAVRERARSLSAGDPWTLAGGTPRANPPIDDGTVAGLVFSAAASWTGPRTALDVGGEIETAGRAAGGEISFGRFQTGGRWRMPTFGSQALYVAWRAQGPLPGTRSLPRQRWSFVGGYGTLPTLPIGALRGDRLVFVESRYLVPVRVGLPVLGRPTLHLIHAVGGAWTDGPDDEGEQPDPRRRLEQNLGFEVHSWSPYVGLYINPRSGNRDPTLVAGFVLPVPRRPPWE